MAREEVAERLGGLAKFSVYSIFFMFAIIVLIILAMDVLVIIPPGYVGVDYNAFGGVNSEQVRYPGWHFKSPIIQKIFLIKTSRDSISMYGSNFDYSDVDQDDVALSVPSFDGLIVQVDATILYSTKAQAAPKIVQEVGLEYKTKTLMPEIRSAVREITGKMRAEDLYGPGRQEFEQKTFDLLKPQFERDGFILEAILVRDITLPPAYLDSIEAKKITEQEAIRKQNEIKVAEYEAQRKAIEADGVAQKTVIEARGQAEGLKAIAEALKDNPNLIQYKTLDILQRSDIKYIFLPTNILPLVNFDNLTQDNAQ